MFFSFRWGTFDLTLTVVFVLGAYSVGQGKFQEKWPKYSEYGT